MPYAEDLEFTTEITQELKPSDMISSTAHMLRITSASFDSVSGRKDDHRVIVGLKLDSTAAEVTTAQNNPGKTGSKTAMAEANKQGALDAIRTYEFKQYNLNLNKLNLILNTQ